MTQPEDTDAAAMLLATDAMLSFIVRRELAREPGARRALQAHVEGEMQRIVGVDEALHAAACDARAIVRRVIGEPVSLRAVR